MTGVSFQYPSALRQVEDVTVYFSPALMRMKVSPTFHAELAFTPPPIPDNEEIKTDLAVLAFLYATEPTSSASACRKLTEGWEGQDSGKKVAQTPIVNGVEFAVGQVSGAGLSHGINGKIYATFRKGSCYLFEEDVVGGDYVGDVTPAQFRGFERHLSAIIHTVRFPTP